MLAAAAAASPGPASPSFSVHKFILAARSPYFYAMFCRQFSESSSASVHLPGDLFNPVSAQVILRYFYTDRLQVPELPGSAKLGTLQRRLSHKKYSLRVLQQVFSAADYLGHSDTVGVAVLHEMACICHRFKCVCTECAVLLPAMLWFADKQAATVPAFRPALINLYADPVHSIAPLWSQKPFAVLVGSIVSADTPTDDDSKKESNMTAELSRITLNNITKHNAIHTLHSLHLCLSQIRSANPFPTWSTPTLEFIQPILQQTVQMISRNFDFYCVEYPILVSCVDNIGFGFSVDFLEFLLTRVLEDGIRDTNAGVLYQGIVRDLVGRQEIVRNVAVDGVLVMARQKCAVYLARRWVQTKAENGFKAIDKDVLRQLSEGIFAPSNL